MTKTYFMMVPNTIPKDEMLHLVGRMILGFDTVADGFAGMAKAGSDPASGYVIEVLLTVRDKDGNPVVEA